MSMNACTKNWKIYSVKSKHFYIIVLCFQITVQQFELPPFFAASRKYLKQRFAQHIVSCNNGCLMLCLIDKIDKNCRQLRWESNTHYLYSLDTFTRHQSYWFESRPSCLHNQQVIGQITVHSLLRNTSMSPKLCFSNLTSQPHIFTIKAKNQRILYSFFYIKS